MNPLSFDEVRLLEHQKFNRVLNYATHPNTGSKHVFSAETLRKMSVKALEQWRRRKAERWKANYVARQVLEASL